jgi:hypothetical protein
MSMHRFLPIIAAVTLPCTMAVAQSRTGFDIVRISPEVVKTPDYQVGRYSKPGERPKDWLEVEVEFKTEAELTPELTVRYYVLFDGQSEVVVGEVSHVNVAKGNDRRSVAYIAPSAIERLLGGKAFNASSIKDIGVEILDRGRPVAQLGWKNKQAWWQQLPQKTGLVLNKSETPFAPLYWDRYEAIRASGR